MNDKTQKRIRMLMSNIALEDGRFVPYRFKHFSIESMAGPKDTAEVTNSPERWEMSVEQVAVLSKLYQQLDGHGQSKLLDQMLEYIEGRHSREVSMSAGLLYIHTNNAEKLFHLIEQNFMSYTQSGYHNALAAIAVTLRCKPAMFSEDLLDAMHDWAEGYVTEKTPLGEEKGRYSSLYYEITGTIGRIWERTNIILSRSFTMQVEDAFNPELNIDEEKVISSLEGFGFSQDLVAQLRHINELIEKANNPHGYRDCMSAIRVFTEKLYGRVAKELDPATKLSGIESDKVAKLFRQHNLISADMYDMIVAVRHFLSNDGTHRIKSKKEDARIAKNVTIELALYLLTRLKEVTG